MTGVSRKGRRVLVPNSRLSSDLGEGLVICQEALSPNKECIMHHLQEKIQDKGEQNFFCPTNVALIRPSDGEHGEKEAVTMFSSPVQAEAIE